MQNEGFDEADDVAETPPTEIATGETFTDREVSIWVMDWVERERGSGFRPDGYSVHTSEDACQKWIADYWARMPDVIPDEYSDPIWERPVKLTLPADHPLVASARKADTDYREGRIWRTFSDGPDGMLYRELRDRLSKRSAPDANGAAPRP